MGKIKSNYCSLKGNMFSISFIDFYVSIYYKEDNDEFILRLIDINSNYYCYPFDNYEDTLEFVEKVVSKANRIEEIDIAYIDLKTFKKIIK